MIRGIIFKESVDDAYVARRALLRRGRRIANEDNIHHRHQYKEGVPLGAPSLYITNTMWRWWDSKATVPSEEREVVPSEGKNDPWDHF